MMRLGGSSRRRRWLHGVWSNDDFRLMPQEQKLTWLHILTGPVEPDELGILRLTEYEVYEGVGLSVPDGDLSERELVRQYIEDFVRLGWLEFDERRGLMRLTHRPHAPKQHQLNPKHLG